MKKTNIKKMLSLIVCSVLIAAIALFTIGCSDNETASLPDSSQSTSSQNETKVFFL